MQERNRDVPYELLEAADRSVAPANDMREDVEEIEPAARAARREKTH
jgi:hypothetical protein